jgi:predicted alpha/beta-fold hydrolase
MRTDVIKTSGMKTMILVVLLLGSVAVLPQDNPTSADQKRTATPPSTVQMTIPSHGSTLLGIFYLAAGTSSHPTAIVLHGFPGFEQNLDLAQMLRSNGWNVLAMHYRALKAISLSRMQWKMPTRRFASYLRRQMRRSTGSTRTT